jgi:hypothetical protein
MRLIWNYIVHHARLWYHSTFFVDKFEIATCPSCGLCGPKKMRFLSQYSKVVFVCPRDLAQWGMDTVVPVERWQIKGLEEAQVEAQAIEDEKITSRERALGIQR